MRAPLMVINELARSTFINFIWRGDHNPIVYLRKGYSVLIVLCGGVIKHLLKLGTRFWAGSVSQIPHLNCGTRCHRGKE